MATRTTTVFMERHAGVRIYERTLKASSTIGQVTPPGTQRASSPTTVSGAAHTNRRSVRPLHHPGEGTPRRRHPRGPN